MASLLLHRQTANQHVGTVSPPHAIAIAIAGQPGPGLSLVLPASNAGALVGAIAVTSPGGPYAGVIALSGADAGKFTLSNGGTYPCNLLVGATALAAGSYNIALTASP